jgi:hypothetical protein
MPRKIRPVRIEGNLAFVTLTKGYEAIIDAKFADIIGAYNWHARVTPWGVYPCRHSRTTAAKETRIHDEIMGRYYGKEVDHKNCNPLDNRTENLRLATKSENQSNKRMPKNNKSGFKGVSYDKENKKWQSHICSNGKRKNLGRYSTKEEAYNAYCAAALIFHGDFSRL